MERFMDITYCSIDHFSNLNKFIYLHKIFQDAKSLCVIGKFLSC